MIINKYIYRYIYISPIMENHMAKKMENESVIKRFIGIGVSRNKGYHCGGLHNKGVYTRRVRRTW